MVVILWMANGRIDLFWANPLIFLNGTRLRVMVYNQQVKVMDHDDTLQNIDILDCKQVWHYPVWYDEPSHWLNWVGLTHPLTNTTSTFVLFIIAPVSRHLVINTKSLAKKATNTPLSFSHDKVTYLTLEWWRHLNNISLLISLNTEKTEESDTEWPLESIAKSLSLYTTVSLRLSADTWTLGHLNG